MIYSLRPIGCLPVTNPVVSVVVPIYENLGNTFKCLTSLGTATNCVAFEVIVVDFGPFDQARDIMAVSHSIRYLRAEFCRGFVSACNLGVSFAQGDYVALLNNNTEVSSGWLDELLGIFNNFQCIGLVGSKLLSPNGVLLEAGGVVLDSGSLLSYGRNSDANDPRYCYTRQVDYLSSTSLMLPRGLWNDIGGFSEAYAS